VRIGDAHFAEQWRKAMRLARLYSVATAWRRCLDDGIVYESRRKSRISFRAEPAQRSNRPAARAQASYGIVLAYNASYHGTHDLRILRRGDGGGYLVHVCDAENDRAGGEERGEFCWCTKNDFRRPNHVAVLV